MEVWNFSEAFVKASGLLQHCSQLEGSHFRSKYSFMRM